MDVTESVLKAKEADARLRVALHAADLASWEYEPETDIWRRSHSVDVIFGFEPGEGGPVAAPFFARMHPDDLLSTKKVVADVMECPDRTAMKFDYRILLPSGEVRHVTSRGEVLRTSTGKVRMIGVLMDVTSDRLREAELSAALAAQGELIEQKELLLAEVNHRVKNSLQLVISTLRLQARNYGTLPRTKPSPGRFRASEPSYPYTNGSIETIIRSAWTWLTTCQSSALISWATGPRRSSSMPTRWSCPPNALYRYRSSSTSFWPGR